MNAPMRDTVVSLCDLTGAFVAPWVAAGYHAVLVDPQHGLTRSDGRTTKLAMTVEEALPHLANLLSSGRVAFVAGWPPCTNLAVSGAKHFERKMADKAWEHYAGPNNYTKKTCLWTGGGFVMPPGDRNLELGSPDDRIHKAAPGPERANFRSATPAGFARAVFAANADRIEAVA